MEIVQSVIESGMNPASGKFKPLLGYGRSEVIKTIKDKKLKALWETGKSRIDSRLHERILLRLAYLDEAETLEHLKIPGFDFHGLHGYSPKRYTIHVNGPWCITFEFRDGDAYAVSLEQYH